MLKPLDPFWVYGIPEDGTNRQQLSCKFCGQKMSRGICRLKYHLFKIPEHDVDVCPNNNSKIMRIAFDSLEAKDKKKDEATTKKAKLSFRSSTTSTPEGHCSGRGSTDLGTEMFASFFVPRTTPWSTTFH
jgi:hypothetical protein